MERNEAINILRQHKVDTFTDARDPVEILQSMVRNGHLPGDLLANEVAVEQDNSPTEKHAKTIDELIAEQTLYEQADSPWVM